MNDRFRLFPSIQQSNARILSSALLYFCHGLQEFLKML